MTMVDAAVEEEETKTPSSMVSDRSGGTGELAPRPLRFCTEMGWLDSAVSAVAVSADSRYLAFGGEDCSVWLWQVAAEAEGTAPTQLKHHDARVTCLAFSPIDPHVLASGCGDASIALWDTRMGRPTKTLLGHSDAINCVVWLPRSAVWLASGGADSTVGVWDTRTGHEVLRFDGHAESVLSLAFSPGGSLLASGSADYTLRLWDMGTGKEAHQLHGHSDSVVSVAFGRERVALPAGGGGGGTGGRVHLASAGGELDGAILIWDPDTGTQLHRIDGAGANGIAFLPDGRVLAAAGRNGEVALWHATAGLKMRVLAGHVGVVTGVVATASGLVASAGEDRSVKLWNTAICTQKLRVIRPGAMNFSAVKTLAMSADSKVAAVGSSEETIRLYADARGDPTATCRSSGATAALAFSPENRRMAVATRDATGLIVFFDPVGGSEVERWSDIGAGMTALAYSRTGRWLAGGATDSVVRLWDMVTGQLRLIAGHKSFISALDFSPNTGILAAASDDSTARLTDMRDWSTHILRGHTRGLSSVKFSEDGALVATGSFDSTVRVWDPLTSRLLHVLGEDSEVTSLAFFDSRSLFAGLRSGVVAVWHATTGVKKPQAEALDDAVTCLCLSPDRRLLLSGCRDGSVVAWDPTAMVQPQPPLCVLARLYDEDRSEVPEEHMRLYPRILSILRESPAIALEEGAWALTRTGRTTRNLDFAPVGLSTVAVRHSGVIDIAAAAAAADGITAAPAAGGTARPAAAAALAPPGSVENPCSLVALAIATNCIAILHSIFTSRDADNGKVDDSTAAAAAVAAAVNGGGAERDDDAVCWALALADTSWAGVPGTSDGADRTQKLASPLHLATECRNELAVDLILLAVGKAWAHFEHNQKRKGLCHPLDNLKAADIIAAMDRFPATANDFWLARHLVPAYSFVQGDCLTGSLEGDSMWLQTAWERSPPGFWSDRNQSEQLVELNDSVISKAVCVWEIVARRPVSQVTAFVVPVQGINNPEFLRACVRACQEANRADIFGSEAVQAVLSHQWELYGRALYMRNFLLYLTLVIVCSVLIFSWDDMINDAGPGAIFAWVLQGIKMVVWTIFLSFESRQIRAEGWRYFSNVWNVIDFTLYALLLSGFIMEIAGASQAVINSIDSSAAVLLWFNVLFFLRAFESTGPMVRMILLITWQLRYFLLLLMVVITGFATAFHGLVLGNGGGFNDADSDLIVYKTFPSSMRTTYGMMLGDFNSDQYAGAELEVQLTIFWAIFMLIVAIVLLNLLIAIVSEGYARIRENATKEWLLEKAAIILETSALLRNSKKDAVAKRGPWLQVMRVARVTKAAAGSTRAFSAGTAPPDCRAPVGSTYEEVRLSLEKEKFRLEALEDHMTELSAAVKEIAGTQAQILTLLKSKY